MMRIDKVIVVIMIMMSIKLPMCVCVAVKLGQYLISSLCMSQSPPLLYMIGSYWWGMGTHNYSDLYTYRECVAGCVWRKWHHDHSPKTYTRLAEYMLKALWEINNVV